MNEGYDGDDDDNKEDNNNNDDNYCHSIQGGKIRDVKISLCAPRFFRLGVRGQVERTALVCRALGRAPGLLAPLFWLTLTLPRTGIAYSTLGGRVEGNILHKNKLINLLRYAAATTPQRKRSYGAKHLIFELKRMGVKMLLKS